MRLALVVLNLILLGLGWLFSYGFLADTSPREQNLALFTAVLMIVGALANLGVAFWPTSPRAKGRAVVAAVTGVNLLVIVGLSVPLFAFQTTEVVGQCWFVFVALILAVDSLLGWLLMRRRTQPSPPAA